VTDPRNLGAVCRSAEGAAATGVVVPAHGSAAVTPVVAKASAGAIEHLPVAVVPNLARYLAEIKGNRLWLYAAAGDGTQTLWETDFTDGGALSARRKGLRPLRRTCSPSAIPSRAGRVAERGAPRPLLYEGRQRIWPRTAPRHVLDRCRRRA
jgi:23S rRNA (guanosine2251-2'-O)-methyltransferase